ncbi:MAG TPA: YlmC/YmxH family sporulation protein [Eubacteriaceae bacterium]|nr:YlmC/YmxH family sporulation protein [Eubacteriaceae bacterium]
MMNLTQFKQLDVVNIIDGKILGNISDFNINIAEGRIENIIIPGNYKIKALFNSKEEYIIPWEDIKKIGEEVILVTYKGDL